MYLRQRHAWWISADGLVGKSCAFGLRMGSWRATALRAPVVPNEAENGHPEVGLGGVGVRERLALWPRTGEVIVLERPQVDRRREAATDATAMPIDRQSIPRAVGAPGS